MSRRPRGDGGSILEQRTFGEDLRDLLQLTPKKDVLFIRGYQNVIVGSQEIPAVTGKFGLGVQIKQGKA